MRLLVAVMQFEFSLVSPTLPSIFISGAMGLANQDQFELEHTDSSCVQCKLVNLSRFAFTLLDRLMSLVD